MVAVGERWSRSVSLSAFPADVFTVQSGALMVHPDDNPRRRCQRRSVIPCEKNDRQWYPTCPPLAVSNVAIRRLSRLSGRRATTVPCPAQK